ncbi:N-acetylglucosamine-6-phosphate deacetylase [Glaciecola sp. KUL10]|jgi:N-acetylglucosamine-6-phosphate deacetylase|uniref:N-acetylglucosamine-6-phosphate deacetylase n=1 Tax=Glaciecola sp. (strain KUL10) TaxID=2161813 RepID=UPI000D78204E|nr:N-acetylglucosamine-6-phosphate deacetylase [Glaciecola sp. KUL10]GBL04555.1 N-acetylglucosamine-6-phosphate deacetylase [Glaciecola sp. KUL10]
MKYFVKRLFDGKQFKQNQLITVENGKVASLSSSDNDEDVQVIEGILAPAYIDVQVNGGGGALLNNEPSLSTIKTMLKAHQQFGTGSMLPTLITDDIDVMKRTADAVASAIAQGVKGVIGVHFEGPHLSGPRKGIHPLEHIRKITDEEMKIFTRKDLGQVCVTVAPENVSLACIESLVRENVIVSLGHSNASDQQTFDAIEAGATGFTHLFNAMSPLTSRASGVVGAALLDDSAYCGLIVDNEHVSINSCKLAIKCKGPEKIMLVTDAMAHVGSSDTTLPFAGMDITRVGNKLTIEGGTLAGSALDMETAVKNAVNLLGCSIGQALQMATSTPAAFLNMQAQKGAIDIGLDADWVQLDDSLSVTRLFIAGQ